MDEIVNVVRDLASDPEGIPGFLWWAVTRPRALAVYLVALVIATGVLVFAGGVGVAR